MLTVKKILSLALALVLMTASLTGCGSGSSNVPPSSSALSGSINLDGSTSMEKVIKILMESFRQLHPNVTISYNASGSGSGITAAIHGTSDMGLSSRQLKDEEVAAGAQAHVIALDGVAIVVHPENPVDDLTQEQIAALFTGQIINWAELGGVDAPVAPLGREPGSGTRGAFEELLDVEDACLYAAEYSSTGDVMGNVASNPNAIGYVSLSSVNDCVKAIKVNGVACSETTVKDGTFPIQRPFLLVTNQDTQLSQAAQAFLDYAMSADVAQLIAQAGAVSPN